MEAEEFRINMKRVVYYFLFWIHVLTDKHKIKLIGFFVPWVRIVQLFELYIHILGFAFIE